MTFESLVYSTSKLSLVMKQVEKSADKMKLKKVKINENKD